MMRADIRQRAYPPVTEALDQHSVPRTRSSVFRAGSCLLTPVRYPQVHVLHEEQGGDAMGDREEECNPLGGRL